MHDKKLPSPQPQALRNESHCLSIPSSSLQGPGCQEGIETKQKVDRDMNQVISSRNVRAGTHSFAVNCGEGFLFPVDKEWSILVSTSTARY